MVHLHKEIWLSKKAQKTLLHNLVLASDYERTESRSHRCFSFCVSSPRPAWQCSHDGTSSCACRAYKQWLRHTPAPPWPGTQTHNIDRSSECPLGRLLKAKQPFLSSCQLSELTSDLYFMTVPLMSHAAFQTNWN